MRNLFIIFGLLIMAQVGFGAIINVPSDQPTIQIGIYASATGDTVLVAPGTYFENIIFYGKVIKVIGSGPSQTILEPLVSRNPAVRMMNEEGEGTEFREFTVTGGDGDYLIVIDNDANPLISNCIFHSFAPNKDASVIIKINSNAMIRNNLFYNNGGLSCIGVAEVGAASIINNTFDNNNRGFHCLSGDVIAINNIVTNSSEYGIYGSFAILDYNCVWNNNPDYDGGAGAGLGSISTDPLYLYAASYDYRLDVFSPCIDAGDPNPEYNDPDGSRNDMGAYPYDLDLPVAGNVNYGPDAVGNMVPTLTPEIYWSYFDTAATSQVEYEIEVGTDDDWSVAEMWATGPVVSSDTQVVYSGAILEDHTTYSVRIRLSNGSTWGGWGHSWFITYISHLVLVPSEQPSIQAAINILNTGDTVLVAPGVYLENIDFGGKAIKVIGSGASQTILEPLVSDRPAVRIMSGEGVGTEFSRFTVTGGDGDNLVEVGNGANPLISHCIFSEYAINKADLSVVVRVWSNATILRNLFYNNGGTSCIGVDEDGTASIINNTFDNNNRGFHCLSGDVVAINNIVTNSLEYGIYGSFALLEYNCVWNNDPDYSGGASAGLGSISVDPRYINAASYDYRVDVHSPCIDAGDPNPEYNDPDGSRNDMGAYPSEHDISLPVAVDINYGPDAVGNLVPTLTPEICWSYFDTAETSQAEYEIEVGTDDDWSVAEMWALGPVSSTDTNTTYSGSTLLDLATYYLRIRLSNGTNWGDWRHNYFTTQIDYDGDGIADSLDNCRFAHNPDQTDNDGDYAGDSCDNCIDIYNTFQMDWDMNGTGDLCDPSGDTILSYLCSTPFYNYSIPNAYNGVESIGMRFSVDSSFKLMAGYFWIIGYPDYGTDLQVDLKAEVFNVFDNLPDGNPLISVTLPGDSVRNLWQSNFSDLSTAQVRFDFNSEDLYFDAFAEFIIAFSVVSEGDTIAVQLADCVTDNRPVQYVSGTWEFMTGYNGTSAANLYAYADIEYAIDSDGDGIYNHLDNCPYRYNPDQMDTDEDGIGDICDFVCGDANGDERVNLGDAAYIINMIFYNGPDPDPMEAGDANADGGVNLGDAGYIIGYIWYSGPSPWCQ